MLFPSADSRFAPGFPGGPQTGPEFLVAGIPADDDGPGTSGGRSFRQRRRNRHGRGLRGDVLLPALPAAKTRSDRFDSLVMDSAERLTELWGTALDHVQFVVDEIPPDLEALVATGLRAPLGSYRPRDNDLPATITVFRRPIESLVSGPEELRELVHEAVIEQAAEALHVAPESVDPIYHRTRRL